MDRIKALFERNSFVLLAFVIIGLICYGNVINGKLMFDDDLLIIHNQFITSLKNIPQFFTGNLNEGAMLGASEFYRPMQNLVYTLVYSSVKLKPWLYHLVSISFHIANSYLVFSIVNKMGFSRFGSFLGAFLFLVHPIQTEAVSYVSGVADPMGMFFMLLALHSFEAFCEKKESPNYIKFYLSIIFFILALLSKEMTVMTPLLVGLITFFSWSKYDANDKRQRTIGLVVFFTVMLSYIALRMTVLNFTGEIGVVPINNLYTDNFLIRITTFICVIWDYAHMFLVPVDLYLEKPYAAYTFSFLSKPRGLFGLFVLIAGISVAVYSYIKGRKKFFIAFLWLSISILPVSGIVPLNAMFLEHWLYFPMIGLAMMLASLYDFIKESCKLKQSLFYKLICLWILIVFSLGFMMRTIARNSEWADPIKFYKNEIKHMGVQRSARVFNNLAMEYTELGQMDKAIPNYLKAIEIWDNYPQSHYNLANAYLKIGDKELAYNHFFEALKIDPSFVYAQIALLKFYFVSGEKEKAKAMGQIAVRSRSGEKISYEEIARLK